MASKAEIEELKLVLLQALTAQIGLLVKSSDPVKTRNDLYQARRDMVEAGLAELQFRLIQIDEGNIAICRGASAPVVPTAAARPSWPNALIETTASADELDL